MKDARPVLRGVLRQLVDDDDGLGPTAGAAQTIDAGDRECYAYSPKALQGLAASGHPFRVSLSATPQARSPCSCRKCVPFADEQGWQDAVLSLRLAGRRLSVNVIAAAVGRGQCSFVG